jgi:hypothetical protein
VASGFARFRPSEEDLCVGAGDIGLASGEALADPGDEIGAEEHGDVSGVGLSIERIGPQDTWNAGGDGFVEDRRIGIVGYDCVEPCKVVDPSNPSIPVLDVAADDAENVEARFPHEETARPNTDLGCVVEGDPHGEGWSIGCHEP